MLWKKKILTVIQKSAQKAMIFAAFFFNKSFQKHGTWYVNSFLSLLIAQKLLCASKNTFNMEIIMNPKKKRKVNRVLRDIQIDAWHMVDDNLMLYDQAIQITQVAQRLKYPLEELEE